jgi:flagellar protein FlgJ
MTPIGTPPAPPASTSPAPQGASAKQGERAKLKEAAKQFEAIFIRQMLAAARKTSFDDGLFDGQGMDTFRQMQDERFADIASQTGALGLASMIEAQLARHLPQEQQ